MARPERERQIVEAAHEQFAARGYSAVTMDDVAARVGVTKPLLYTYFGNKERLYLACLDEAATHVTAHVTASVADASTPDDALRTGLRSFMAYVEQHSDRWRLFYDDTVPAGGEIAARVGAERDRLAAFIAESIAALTGTGAAAPAVDALAHTMMGAVEALAKWWLRTDAMPAPAAAELLIAAIEPGIQAALSSLDPAPDQETDQ